MNRTAAPRPPTDLEAWLNGIWYEGRGGGFWLRPLALLFALLVRLRRAAYRVGLLTTTQVSRPVIVVGNLSVGGTGKTPFTAWLATALGASGLRVGILCRGYGGSLRLATRVDAESDPRVCGDEPVLLARQISTVAIVVASPDRVAGAQELVRANVDLIVCDDGLQHYALARDLEIALVDGVRGLGNGRLLPAGPLREPASRLESVDIVVVHGGDPAADVAWRGRKASIRMGLRLLDARPVSAVRADGDRGSGGVLRSRALKEFCGSPVHAVAGIGRPQRFFEALQAEGLHVVAHAFPDHHDFRPTDLDFGDAYPVLMTSKDAVKCRQFSNALLWEIPVQATIADHDAASILGLVRALSGGR